MINSIKNLFKFILNPITDDWNGGISLVRLTFIAIMYGTYQNILDNKGIDWSVLVIILFILIYMCFKGEAPELIGKLLDSVGSLKSETIKNVTKKTEAVASVSENKDTQSS